jgi:hypothetical protein
MDIKEIFDRAERQIEEYVQEQMTLVTASSIGEGYHGEFFVNDECVVAEGDAMRQRLDHYAGFEYLDDQYVKRIGRFTVYYDDGEMDEGENGYVREIISKWKEKA